MKPSRQIRQTTLPIVTSGESRKPGYLARRMVRYRLEQEAQTKKAADKIIRIKATK